MRRCVIFNPVARGEKARQFQAQLAQLSAQCTLRPTQSPGAGRTLAAEAVREQFDVIIAAGGDGTLNEVLNGIGDASGFDRVSLGVLPLGTVNVFAKEIGLPTDVPAAWRVVEQNQVDSIDLPWAEFQSNERRVRRFFVQLAGAGLDARAVELVDWQLKKKIGPLAYVVAGWHAMQEAKSKIRVSGDDWNDEGEMVLIGNGRYYGGKYRLFPKANLKDGRIDVTVFPNMNWATATKAGVGWLVDQLVLGAGARTYQASRVTLNSAGEIPLQLDGELVGRLPATLEVGHAKLRVIVPR